MSTKTMKPMIIIATNDYNFGSQWSNGLHVFSPTHAYNTFEGNWLAFAGKFLPKEWPGIADFSVFVTILFKLPFNLEPVHTYPDIFESATSSFRMRFPPTARTRCIRHTNPQRFLMRNRVLAKLSGNMYIYNFLSSDFTRWSPVLCREYSRRCWAQCYRFFSFWTSVLSLITCVQLNLAMITAHFEASLHWRTDKFDAVKKLNEQ